MKVPTDGDALPRSKLWQTSGGTAADRRCEADRLLAIISDFDYKLNEWESRFVEDCGGDRPITPKMLFKLRDIKDAYL